MNFIKGWVQANISRRSFIFLSALGLYRFVSSFSSTVVGGLNFSTYVNTDIVL